MATRRVINAVTDLASVRNIWCAGRNYVEHASELGNAVPSSPIIFLKAGNCITSPSEPIILPKFSKDIHHEVELAVQFGPDLSIAAAAVALDLTARQVQKGLMAQRLPWTLGKSFPRSCPIGPFFSVDGLDWTNLQLHLSVNGDVRQSASTNKMIFPVSQLVSFVKEHFPVLPGDIILTGTPAGVNVLKAKDVVEASVSVGDEVLSAAKWDVVDS